jgi:hypothetical protein
MQLSTHKKNTDMHQQFLSLWQKGAKKVKGCTNVWPVKALLNKQQRPTLLFIWQYHFL